MRSLQFLKIFVIPMFLFFSTGCKKDKTEALKEYGLAEQHLDIEYGNNPFQKMDIYLPEGFNTATPVVFVIHGGGFIAGSKEEFSTVAKMFTTRGYVTVNLSHRLIDATGISETPPQHVLSDVRVVHQVDDIAAAVEKYKTIASQYSTGTSRMYMAGHSAGGTLAMLYVQGSKNTDGQVRASGNLAGLTNVTVPSPYYTNPPEHVYWSNVKELLYRMSGFEVVESNALSIMAISPNWVTINNAPGKPNISVMPKSNDEDLQFAPFFSTINDAKAYHDDLKKNGIKSDFILMDTDHGFGNQPGDWQTAVDHTVRFFQEVK